MSQEESKKIMNVNLRLEDGFDYLEFNINGKIHKLNVNSEENQEEIKKMFCDLIPLIEVNEVEISLIVEDDYDNTLLREVCTSYIKDLNAELDSVRASIAEKTSEAEPNW